MNLEMEDLDQPAAADQHLRQAYVYEEGEQYEQALSECDAAIVVAKAFLADVHNLRGIVLEELGRNEEALEAYRVALLTEPGFSEAADNLLELEHELGIKYELVTIATFNQAAEAHVLRAKLEAEGVWVSVADEGIVTMNWLYSNAVGGVKLKVREQVESSRVWHLNGHDLGWRGELRPRPADGYAPEVRYYDTGLPTEGTRVEHRRLDDV